ncbi:MAG: hypothetical protein NTZ17_07915 [Phycisphaerae bacterium]|nr:hypothetical protein [Phycisphaerae bacterium]
MKQAKGKISMASAAKVAGIVNLQAVKLLECNCKRRSSPPGGSKTFDIKQAFRFELNDEQNALGVSIQFVLNATDEGKEQKKENTFLSIGATFVLWYSIDSKEGLDDKALGSFATLNGTYNAWPYWREFVQSVTSRMGLPPLTIPVFRLPRGPAKPAVKKKAGKLEAATKN